MLQGNTPTVCQENVCSNPFIKFLMPLLANSNAVSVRGAWRSFSLSIVIFPLVAAAFLTLKELIRSSFEQAAQATALITSCRQRTSRHNGRSTSSVVTQLPLLLRSTSLMSTDPFGQNTLGHTMPPPCIQTNLATGSRSSTSDLPAGKRKRSRAQSMISSISGKG